MFRLLPGLSRGGTRPEGRAILSGNLMSAAATFRRIAPYLALLALLIGFDQVTKEIAQRTIARSLPKSYAGDIFRLQYAENRGGFLSLGANLSSTQRSFLFVGVSGIGLFLLAFFGFRGQHHTAAHKSALTLVVGGGVSNLLDRIFYDGVVIDFMNMGIGPLRTGVFNFADNFIMAGAAWLLIQHLRPSSPQEDEILPSEEAGAGEAE